MANPPPFKPYTPGQERFGSFMINRVGRLQAWVYELTGGRLWNTFLGGQVAILTVTGRRSGRQRKIPLLYIEDGERVVMAASKGGMSAAPLWYHNVVANPRVQVQVGARRRAMVAREATPAEEDRLWPKLEAMYPAFAEYRARTVGVRHIPVIVFDPA